MVNVEQKYGSVFLSVGGPKVAALPLTGPVDDVIALAYDTPHRELSWLAFYGFEVAADFGLIGLDESKWDGPVLGWTDSEEAAYGESGRVRRWRRGDVPATFLKAARRASAGRFPPELAKYLARVTFVPGGADEVPGFLELAAWCLDRVLRSERFEIRNCGVCGVPFLSSGRSRYCRRRAPDSGQECVDVGKVRDYQARRKRARKEKGEKRG